MIWTNDMLSPSRGDIHKTIPTENQPDIHAMLKDGVVVNGNWELPPSLEVESVEDIGERISDNFDALDAQRNISEMRISTPQ